MESSCVGLSKPVIVGYMSVDIARTYYSDLSQLKYLNNVYNGSTSFDLNHNINSAVKRTTDNNEEKIDLLLKFLIDKHQLISVFSEVDFISYRRTLISVMYSAFTMPEPILVNACLFKGSIYLCSIDSTREISRKKSRSKEEEKFCAWGYKFEQYLLSDEPDLVADIDKPVIENEEFSLYYYTKLGNFKLLYGAQIDGLLTNEHTLQKPKTDDFETNLNYLKKNNYVELKTNREIHNFKQDRNFRRFKLFNCWCQCYLANLKGLYVGFRNDQGIIKRLQWFDTQDIVSICRNEWHPQIAVHFLHNFLSFVKHTFESHQNRSNLTTLQFQINVDKTISVSENSTDILSNWFTEAI